MVQRSRHWVVIWLGAIILGAWFSCTFLLVPATTFAAASARNESSYSSSACGVSGGAPLLVMTSNSGASIWLNHTTGPIGTSLVVSGAGWPAATTVTIDAYGDNGAGQAVLGQAALAQARTFSDGIFQTAPFPAPAGYGCGMGTDYGAPGSVVLFRAHIRGNRVSAEARFTYLATPSFSPPDLYPGSGVIPGSVLPLSGQNWGPDQLITITTEVTFGQTQEELDNTGVAQPSGSAPIQVRTTAHGVFTTQVVVPTDIPFAPSPYDAFAGLVVSVSATDPRYGTFTPAPLVLTIMSENTPTFTASLTQGLPGTVVTLTGTNWPPGLVLLDYCRGQVQAPGTAQVGCYNVIQGIGFADLHGLAGPANTFSVEVTIPPNARPGLITLQASIDSDVLPDTYTLDLPFDILTPTTPEAPWQLIHPRLAEALLVGDVAIPLLLLMGGGAGAAVLWRRRRQSKVQQVD
jgi:hypothetical protein